MSPSTETRETREFAREIKFRLLPELAEAVREWVGPRLQGDPNASSPDGSGYDITSLYCDTPEFDVFQRRGSYGRSKYRIRRYGRSEVVFLERKMRTQGKLTKRRSIIPMEELARLERVGVDLGTGRPLTQPSATLSPSDGERDGVRGFSRPVFSNDAGSVTYSDTHWSGRWFHRRLMARRLAPVARIAYRRTARVAMTVNGPIRLTIDEDLRATTVHGFDFFGSEPAVPVLPGYAILELKFLRDLPALFKALVEEFALVPEPTSKYRLAVDALRLVAPTCSTHEVRSASQGSSLLQPCPNS